MSATILAGRIFAADLRRELAEEALARRAELGYVPELAIVVLRDLRGASDSDSSASDVSASDVYVRQLLRTALSIGIPCRLIDLPTDTDATILLQSIAHLNDEPHVHGILVQLPLPGHLSRSLLLDAIDPAKDVDGIGAVSAGNLFLNRPAHVPATCAAIIELLDRANIALDGQRAVVVGASAVVGRPLSMLLLQRHATVSICHIYTEDLGAFTREADVIVVAAGSPNLLTARMVRPGAVVIDVGINVLEGGRIGGDVDFAEVQQVAGAITPVPGGIGPLTNLMVMRQTLRSLQ